MTPLPIDCVIAITYQCNSRCKMCDIWKLKDEQELAAGDFRKLPATLADINISGGEPFLRFDLVKIIEVIRQACPDAKLIISTNGMMTELIKQQTERILKIVPDVGVAVSIDGIDAMHDQMRGVPASFEKAIATIQTLQQIGLRNLRLAFTAGAENISHLSKVYDLARDLGVEFTIAAAQSSPIFFGGKQITEEINQQAVKEQFDYLVRQELKSWQPKKWLRAYFARGLSNFIVQGKAPLPVYAGRDFFFLDPFGEVYPSVVHSWSMGNLIKQTFEEIWFSAKAEEARQKIAALSPDVWMICTARTAMRRHFWKVGWWILRNKTRYLL